MKRHGRGKSAERKPAKAPKRRRAREGHARPQQIVAAAFEEFAEKGFAGTRLEDVAARAKVSKGLPYLYFKTKVELFKAVIRSVISAHFDVIRAQHGDDRPQRRRVPQRPVPQIRPGSSARLEARLHRAAPDRRRATSTRSSPQFYYEVVVSRGHGDADRSLSIAASRAASFKSDARCATFRNCSIAPVLTADHLAVAVRAPPSPRYRRAARHQHRVYWSKP